MSSYNISKEGCLGMGKALLVFWVVWVSAQICADLLSHLSSCLSSALSSALLGALLCLGV